MNFKNFITLLLISSSLISCSNEDELINKEINTKVELSEHDKQNLMDEFGKALSSVVANSEEVRNVLKISALRQFDKNYDILWGNIEQEEVDGKSIKELITEKTSIAFQGKSMKFNFS